MTKRILFCALLTTNLAAAQSFAPAPDEPGTTAIDKDSSCFMAWADGGTIYRGFININDTTATYDGSNRATFGVLNNAFGPAEGNLNAVVSLGDSGYVTLTFPLYIMDGPGFDFAVFENSFDDHYMELGHVEISSDGENFFRFPSTSEIPLDEQLNNFSYSNCGYVNNLAGKYRAGYGTPFDLADIPDNVQLNKQAVTHVRIIDAIGAITGIGTTDQYDTIINDPYPTAFASCGFDLDAVGVINGTVGLDEQQLNAAIYPNPTSGMLHIQLEQATGLQLYGIDGKLLWASGQISKTSVDLKALGLDAGTYQLVIGESIRKQIILL